MNRKWCSAFVGTLVIAMCGCSHTEPQVQPSNLPANTGTARESDNGFTWADLDRRAPAGRRWAAHPDTHAYMSHIYRNDNRFRDPNTE